MDHLPPRPGPVGLDPEAGEPITPVLDWQSARLDGPIWGQPLLLGSRVYVATTADGVYALDASSGHTIWHVSAGTPVPSGELQCGDITPTVGIVGTPVIDTATGTLYAVADVWNPEPKEARHVLKGYSLSEGGQVLSTPVDPPGAEPAAYLQRTALNLDTGRVIFGFGGNDGDCADYRGTVAAVPEDGGKPRFWQYQPKAPSVSGGAVWGASGPVVGPEGDIYASTGNPNPTEGTEVSEFPTTPMPSCASTRTWTSCPNRPRSQCRSAPSSHRHGCPTATPTSTWARPDPSCCPAG